MVLGLDCSSLLRSLCFLFTNLVINEIRDRGSIGLNLLNEIMEVLKSVK